MHPCPLLPPGVTVLERGWLSSNNTVLLHRDHTALVDSGYCTHAAQTLALVAHTLAGRPLDRLLNTHLHSDHCGGNAALQARYPALRTAIPAGMAQAVADWNEARLGYAACGQSIVRYGFDDTLTPGEVVSMGGGDGAALSWEVHAAPGHDPHALLLFEPASRTLISADALWARGFGVVFPELDGEQAFAAVGQTLDLIERLRPAVVIPGHGPVFADVAVALAEARRRLEAFVREPQRHVRHAARVLVKFKLMEWGTVQTATLHAWGRATPLLAQLHRQCEGAPEHLADWLDAVVEQLVASGAARRLESAVADAP